jgi:hypothetical protein
LILGVSQVSSKEPGDKGVARASEILKEELGRQFLHDESIARCGTCGAGPDCWCLNVFTFATEEKAQAHLCSLDQTRLGEMIPPPKSTNERRARIEGRGLHLRVQLVPTPLHGINLRKAIGASKWARTRRSLLAEHDGQCEYCGTTIESERDLHIHEEWRYETSSHNTAILEARRIICWRCHACVHFGRTLKVGLQESGGEEGVEALIDHFWIVNGLDRQAFDTHFEDAAANWKRLSKVRWAVDLGSFR